MRTLEAWKSSLKFGGMLLACAIAVDPAWADEQAPDTIQPELTLAAALKLAKERNGTIRAAMYDVKAAEQRLVENSAGFYPTIGPNYTYTSARQQYALPLGTAFIQQEGGATAVNTNWLLLDSGEREYGYRSSLKSLYAQRATAKQTLRTTLFDVTQQYYDTLRYEELQSVADAQVSRAAEILRATDQRIDLGDAAKLERLQANADVLNARVQFLTAKNQASNAVATLKATIGYDASDHLPQLARAKNEPEPPIPDQLDPLIDEGLAKRPDLDSLRRNVDSAHFTELKAQREASLTFSLNAVYDQQVTPVGLQDRSLIFSVSYPLFDGGLLRGEAREQAAVVNSQKATLLQSERAARAEIEAAFAELHQNSERLSAASAAQDAAKENYRASIDAQRAGANGLLDVLTAQLSLDTAESDYIQAVYDYKISAVRLNLVTGRELPGE